MMMGWVDGFEKQSQRSAGDLARSSTARFRAEQFTMIPIGFIVQLQSSFKVNISDMC